MQKASTAAFLMATVTLKCVSHLIFHYVLKKKMRIENKVEEECDFQQRVLLKV
jgi:hypothetical protein